MGQGEWQKNVKENSGVIHRGCGKRRITKTGRLHKEPERLQEETKTTTKMEGLCKQGHQKKQTGGKQLGTEKDRR